MTTPAAVGVLPLAGVYLLTTLPLKLAAYRLPLPSKVNAFASVEAIVALAVVAPGANLSTVLVPISPTYKLPAESSFTSDAVKGSIQPYDDIKLWNFTAAVHAGDTDAALRLVREVMDKPENIAGPLFVLAADAIVIWELKHSSAAEYAEASGLSPYRISALQSAARTATPEQAARAVNLTKRALDYMFTGHGDPSVLLDELIVRLCSLRRGRHRTTREAIA